MSSSGQPIPFRMHSLQHPPVVTREQNQYLEPALAERRDALSPGVHSELNISNLTFKDRQNASPRALSPTKKSGLVKVRQNSALMMDESPLNRDLDNSFTRKAKELNRTISFKPLSSFGDRTEIESK